MGLVSVKGFCSLSHKPHFLISLKTLFASTILLIYVSYFIGRLKSMRQYWIIIYYIFSFFIYRCSCHYFVVSKEITISCKLFLVFIPVYIYQQHQVIPVQFRFVVRIFEIFTNLIIKEFYIVQCSIVFYGSWICAPNFSFSNLHSDMLSINLIGLLYISSTH